MPKTRTNCEKPTKAQEEANELFSEPEETEQQTASVSSTTDQKVQGKPKCAFHGGKLHSSDTCLAKKNDEEAEALEEAILNYPNELMAEYIRAQRAFEVN